MIRVGTIFLNFLTMRILSLVFGMMMFLLNSTIVFSQSNDEVPYGDLHNSSLKEIVEDQERALILKSKTLIKASIVNHVGSKTNGYTPEELNLVMEEGTKIIARLDVDFQRFTSSEAKKVTKYLVQQNKISKQLAFKFNSVINDIFSEGGNVESVLNQVRILNNNEFNKNDRYYADVFSEIFNSSYDFWSGDSDNGIVARFGWKHLVTVLADTAGGVIGATIGGIGAPIIGGYASALWVGANIPIL